MNLKGYRTLIIAAFIAVGGVVEASTSVLHQLLGERVGAVVALVVACAMAALRVITTGPVVLRKDPPADEGGAPR